MSSRSSSGINKTKMFQLWIRPATGQQLKKITSVTLERAIDGLHLIFNCVFVSVLMPDPKDGSKPFTGEEASIPGSNIKLKLHYMFFDKETIEITDSSL